MDKQLERLHQIEREMLKVLIKVCSENGLRYFLLGGSCLGAVRHGGFIPWDDDIDVGLPREDYDKLMGLSDQFPSYYFLQNMDSDPEYMLCFAKLRDSRTTYIEKSIRNWKINHGVYIDIFPLDHYTDRGGFFFRCRDRVLKSRVAAEFTVERKWSAKFLLNLTKVLCPDAHVAASKRDRWIRSARKGEMVANYGGAWGHKETMPRAWFGEGKEILFEGLNVRIPENSDAYLTQLYGDYMTPPPPEKRVGHHYANIVDLDKPYTEYIK